MIRSAQRSWADLLAEHVPRLTGVDRHVDAQIGADVEHVGVLGVFANHVDRTARDIGGQVLPGLAVVGRLPEIGCEVVMPLAVLRHEDGALVVLRRHDARDPAVRRDAVHDLFPVLAAVVRHVHFPVVGADVDQPQLERRFGDRGDGLVGDVPLFVRIVVGQVGADLLELVAAVP